MRWNAAPGDESLVAQLLFQLHVLRRLAERCASHNQTLALSAPGWVRALTRLHAACVLHGKTRALSCILVATCLVRHLHLLCATPPLVSQTRMSCRRDILHRGKVLAAFVLS